MNINTTNISVTNNINPLSSISDHLKLTEMQSIINLYVSQLSLQNYDSVPSNITINNKYIFPHLSMKQIISAMSNKTFWFGGDSTLENLFAYFLFVLQEYNNTNKTYNPKYLNIFNFEYKPSLIGYSSGIENIRNIRNTTFYTTKTLNIPRNKIYFNGRAEQKYIVYNKFDKYNTAIYGAKIQECAYYPSLYIIETLPIDILITNMDLLFCLHLLNAFGGGTMHWKQYNINFENRMEQFIQNSINNNIKCLIIFGSNSVDNCRYTRNWNESLILWDINNVNKESLIDCFNRTGFQPNQIVINTTNTSSIIMNGEEWCKYNTLTAFGSHQINERMIKWIKWKQNQLDNVTNLKFKLLYFNQSALTENRTKYTRDGRHYPSIVPVKMEVVTNIISNFC